MAWVYIHRKKQVYIVHSPRVRIWGKSNIYIYIYIYTHIHTYSLRPFGLRLTLIALWSMPPTLTFLTQGVLGGRCWVPSLGVRSVGPLRSLRILGTPQKLGPRLNFDSEGPNDLTLCYTLDFEGSKGLGFRGSHGLSPRLNLGFRSP